MSEQLYFNPDERILYNALTGDSQTSGIANFTGTGYNFGVNYTATNVDGFVCLRLDFGALAPITLSASPPSLSASIPVSSLYTSSSTDSGTVVVSINNVAEMCRWTYNSVGNFTITRLPLTAFPTGNTVNIGSLNICILHTF